MAKYSKEDTDNARKMLKKFLRPGATVYTVLRYVSQSGMSRRIDLYTIGRDAKRKPVVMYLSGYAAVLMGYPRPDNGIKVQGCGMDMGFHLVYNLGGYLWPKGTNKPHGVRNGEPDSDGGYALNHRWL
jgi:hypothetical protein